MEECEDIIIHLQKFIEFLDMIEENDLIPYQNKIDLLSAVTTLAIAKLSLVKDKISLVKLTDIGEIEIESN